MISDGRSDLEAMNESNPEKAQELLREKLDNLEGIIAVFV